MAYVSTLLQISVFLGVLGFGAFYMMKKTRKHQLYKHGENGIIRVKDGVYLNQQTSAFLFEIEGRQVFTVLSNHGVHSIPLQEKSFSAILETTLEEKKQAEGARNAETAN